MSALLATIEHLQTKIRAQTEALIFARDQFLFYEQQHLAKIVPGTAHNDDAQRKADRNREAAGICQAAIEAALL